MLTSHFKFFKNFQSQFWDEKEKNQFKSIDQTRNSSYEIGITL